MIDSDLNLEIKLPKVPDIELVAIQGLEKMGGYFGISEDKIGEARVLVTEAIINGLEHSGDDNPNVSVEFKMTKERLIILGATRSEFLMLARETLHFEIP